MRNAEITINAPKKVRRNREFKVEVSIPKELGNVSGIEVLFNKFGEEPSVTKKLEKTKEEEFCNVYSAKVCLKHVCKYFFFFVITINGHEMCIKISRQTGKPFLTLEESPYWVILVVNDFMLNHCYKGKLVYQIFIDRFNRSSSHEDSNIPGRKYASSWEDEVDYKRNQHGYFHNNQFYCGDIQGIIEKLDYLESLGVDILYISPINPSPEEYHHYAATDHGNIDPDVGTFEDLKELHEKCHKKKMQIILDIAFNHCSVGNYMYLDAVNNPNSKYKNWFNRDSNGNITFWAGFANMPEFNQTNPEFVDYVCGIVKKFIPEYVDGLRIDLAESIDYNLLEAIRNAANEQKGAYVVGEWWQHPPIEILGRGIDASTCYPLTNAIHKFMVYGEADTLKGTLQEMLDNYPQDTLDSLLSSLSTHDIIRAITIIAFAKYMKQGYIDIWKVDEQSQWHHDWGFDTDGFREFEYENDKINSDVYNYAKNVFKLETLLQYFLIGNACVFYADEAGVSGWKDPFNRKPFPWESIDGDLLKFFRELGTFRKQCNLVECNPEVIYSDDKLFIFKRKNNVNSIYVAINRGENERYIEIPGEFKNGKKFVLNEFNNSYLSGKSGIVIKA